MINWLELTTALRIDVRHAVEVGVNEPKLCRLACFIHLHKAHRFTLIEPLVDAYTQLKETYASYAEVSVLNWAIVDKVGPISMYNRGQSSFVSTVANTPAVLNDKYDPSPSDLFIVDGHTIDEIDDGQIDLLLIDAEGCEIYSLIHLRSRPVLLFIETHCIGKAYVNPFMEQIAEWLQNNGYRCVAEDEADTAWLRFPNGWLVEHYGLPPLSAFRLRVRDLENIDGASKMRILSSYMINLNHLLDRSTNRTSDLPENEWFDLQLSSVSYVDDDLRQIELLARAILTAAIFKYERVGHDHRHMTFLSDGTIGAGAAECEQRWTLCRTEGHPCQLQILSAQSVTCALTPFSATEWRGRWLDHEQMPIILRMA